MKKPALISAADATQKILRAVKPLPAARVSLSDCTGRVLRETIRSDRPQPPYDRVTMDGYALIREVRKHEHGSGRRMRAMALTAFARIEDRDLAVAAGFDRHMAKPILPEQLLQAVAQVVTGA